MTEIIKMENDLADRLDDLICAFDSGFDSASGNLESIVLVLLVWSVLAFCIYVVVYRLFKTNQASREVDEPDLKKEDLPEKSDPVKEIEPEVKKEKSPVKEILTTKSSAVKNEAGRLLTFNSSFCFTFSVKCSWLIC